MLPVFFKIMISLRKWYFQGQFIAPTSNKFVDTLRFDDKTNQHLDRFALKFYCLLLVAITVGQLGPSCSTAD